LKESKVETYKVSDIDILAQEIINALPEELRTLGPVGIKATEQ
jgi:hypothetical protein